MSKARQCPICESRAISQPQSYATGKKNKNTGEEIIVENVELYNCQNEECGYTWLPVDQERRIDQIVAKETRFDLLPEEIKTVRNSFCFPTKFQLANFLCLNEKAFTKWELGYSEPNRAYDLLLRLAAFSQANVDFIKHLHSTNFKFDPSDYQLICEQRNTAWNFFHTNMTLSASRQIANEIPQRETSYRPFLESTFIVKSNNEEALAA